MSEEPLRTTTFTLGRADALAYEQAAFRMTPLGVLALLVWLGACGAGALLVPADWAGPRLGWASTALVSIGIATGYVVALLLVALRQALAARRRIRQPLELTVTEWPDRLDIVGGGPPRSVGFSDIRDSRLTRTHLLLTMDDGALILPRRAFREEGAVEALAGRIAGHPRPAPVDPVRPSA